MFGAPPPATSLQMSPDARVFRQVAQKAHPDFRLLERAVNQKTGKLRSEIVIDDVREVIDFLHLKPSAGKWRVVIVDSGVILTNLVKSVRADEYLRLTRSVGPSSVSANTTPEPVLRAVAKAVGGDQGDALADELLRVRARGDGITRQDITSAVNSVGLSNDQRVAALRLLAIDVELWAVIVELRGGVGAERGRLLSRYGGLARLRVGASASSNAAGSTQLGSFLTWKELDATTDGFSLEDLDDDT